MTAHTLDHVGSYKGQSQSSGPDLPVCRVRETLALLSTPQHPDIQYCVVGIARVTPHIPFKGCFPAAFTSESQWAGWRV